jgi:putative oxidoreductase
MLSRSQDGALLLGRVLVAALFLPSGFNHVMGFSGFATFLDSKGLPYPEIVGGILVAAEFLGPIALIVGLWPRVTALALIGFAAATLWLTHGPSALRLIMRPGQNGEFFEQLAIMGGLLFYFASGPGAWSRTSLR